MPRALHTVTRMRRTANRKGRMRRTLIASTRMWRILYTSHPLQPRAPPHPVPYHQGHQTQQPQPDSRSPITQRRRTQTAMSTCRQLIPSWQSPMFSLPWRTPPTSSVHHYILPLPTPHHQKHHPAPPHHHYKPTWHCTRRQRTWMPMLICRQLTPSYPLVTPQTYRRRIKHCLCYQGGSQLAVKLEHILGLSVKHVGAC